VSVNVVPKRYFQGIPSPLAAVTIATGIVFYHEMSSWFSMEVSKENYMLGLVMALASLMICTIRFPSFKEFKVKRSNTVAVLALFILTLILIAVKPEVTLFLMSLSYILIGLASALVRFVFRRSKKQTPALVSNPEN
jgi:CDP-diacylglycerol--serine O-phosphatidyltransferase